jgi:hypothetical protein
VSACGGGTDHPKRPPVYPKVFGTVGPGPTITLRNQAGKAITSLKPGMYSFRIADRSTTDDFHLEGPTVDLTTSIKGKTRTAWLLTMNPGAYRFYSDGHVKTLSGTFTVR